MGLKRVLDFLSGDLFLVAISTFRRCGDIQALRIGDGFMSIVPEGIIFIREGLAKQDRPGHVGSKIFVPCFQRTTSWTQRGLYRLM